MEYINNLIESINLNDRRGILLLITYINAIFVFPFMICSFIVASTANVGFNVVLTTLLNISFVFESYYIIHNSKTPIAIGFLIGSSIMISFLSLITFIFWIQLSKCQSVYEPIPQYSCGNTSAYMAIAVFIFILFVIQSIFTSLVIFWKSNLISEIGLYDEVQTTETYDVSNRKYRAPTADL